MEQSWNIDKAEMILLRSGDLDLEYIVGKPLIQKFNVVSCTGKTHTFRSLNMVSHTQ